MKNSNTNKGHENKSLFSVLKCFKCQLYIPQIVNLYLQNDNQRYGFVWE